MIITAAWAFVLLGRATAPYSTLRWPVLIIGSLPPSACWWPTGCPRRWPASVLGLALLSAGTGPAAYAVQTAATPHQGSIVTAGPVSGNSGPGGQGGIRTHPDRCRTGRQGGRPRAARSVPQGGAQGGQPGRDGASVSTELAALLRSDASSYRWAAATTGSQSAAAYQLATELPVMAIGGFTGSDASPTLAQFQAYVAQGDIHYYLSGGNGGGRGGGSGSASRDRDLGQRELHRHHGRKRRSLRPHRRPLSRPNDRSGPTSSRHAHRDQYTGTDSMTTDPRLPSRSTRWSTSWCRCTTKKSILRPSVRRLDGFLAEHLPVLLLHHDRRQREHRPHLVGGSGPRGRVARVRAVHLDQKGRGRALKAVWSESSAPILAYMDVDLSTDLRALLPLVAPLISGHSDIAIGSRLAGPAGWSAAPSGSSSRAATT